MDNVEECTTKGWRGERAKGMLGELLDVVPACVRHVYVSFQEYMSQPMVHSTMLWY